MFSNNPGSISLQSFRSVFLFLLPRSKFNGRNWQKKGPGLEGNEGEGGFALISEVWWPKLEGWCHIIKRYIFEDVRTGQRHSPEKWKVGDDRNCFLMKGERER